MTPTILVSVTSRLKSTKGCSFLQSTNGHVRLCCWSDLFGYETFSQVCGWGRQLRQTEFPHGSVTGSLRRYEHRKHCTSRTTARACWWPALPTAVSGSLT